MSLFRRFFGDDHNLKAANLETAPQLTIDLSGTQLTIPCPRQTLMMPGDFQQTRFNIAKVEFDFYNDDRISTKKIHKNGWNFLGKQRESPGYVYFTMFLVQPHIFSAEQSLLDKKVLKQWVMNHVNNGSWVKRNKKLSKLEDWHPDKHKLFQYPQSEAELKFDVHVNGYYFDVIEPRINEGQAIVTYYCIPIDKKHLVHLIFSSGVVDEEYFSSEHNFAEASAKFIKDFMSRVTIELSDEAKQQKQAAEQKMLTSSVD